MQCFTVCKVINEWQVGEIVRDGKRYSWVQLDGYQWRDAKSRINLRFVTREEAEQFRQDLENARNKH